MKTTTAIAVLALAGLGSTIGTSSLAAESAEDYPAKPVRVLVPFSAGGGVDMLARLVGARLAESMGQPFVVSNRTGAGGTIGVATAARAAPDGYTLVLTSNSLVFNATLYMDLPYDTLNDLAPISLVATSPNVLVVHPAVPARTVPEFIRVAKARRLNYGSGGVGGSSQVCAEYFLDMAGITSGHVPYKGAPPALADLMAGNIDFSMSPMAPVPPLVKARRLRAIAVTSAKRASIMAEVPAIAESLPRFEYSTWYGLFAPAAVPPRIVSSLNGALRKALAGADLRERMLRDGLEPAWNEAAAYKALVKAEIAKWAPIIRRTQRQH